VWIGAAALLQYVSWRLVNYAELVRAESETGVHDGVPDEPTAAEA
jgi:hypothetical protein